MPQFWHIYMHEHPALEDMPRITHTSTDVPGDPLTVDLTGTEPELAAIMEHAGWYIADRLGPRADPEIAADTVLKRPYVEAPVSRLYVLGRREDFAFEKPVGNNPRQRHHLRWWKSPQSSTDGCPF